MTPHELMHRIDALASHVWVVRTFVKHSEEAEESTELMEIVRDLYDFCLALGPSLQAGDAEGYLKIVRKKLPRLERAAQHFAEVAPQVSAHTNFKMAVQSLATAVGDIARLMSEAGR